MAKKEYNLDERIDRIVKTSQTMGPELHSVLVQCLIHCQPEIDGGFSDPRKLDRLIKGVHKSHAPQAMQAWVKKYSPVTWNGEGQVKLIPNTNKLFKAFDIDGAMANPYWNGIEVVKKPLTLAAILKIVEGMDKKIDKAEEANLIAEGEDVATMRAVVAAVQRAANQGVAAITVVKTTGGLESELKAA